eukprot:2735395-Rhodomonas_salina.1
MPDAGCVCAGALCPETWLCDNGKLRREGESEGGDEKILAVGSTALLFSCVLRESWDWQERGLLQGSGQNMRAEADMGCAATRRTTRSMRTSRMLARRRSSLERYAGLWGMRQDDVEVWVLERNEQTGVVSSRWSPVC